MPSSWQTIWSKVNNISGCNSDPGVTDDEHQAATVVHVDGGAPQLRPIGQVGTDAGDFSAYITGWGIESPYEVTLFPISPLVVVRARLVKREGFETGRWVLIDYGEVVVHLFYQEVRGFYDLEGLWSEAPREQVA